MSNPQRPKLIDRRGGFGVFSNGGLEPEQWIEKAVDYMDHLEARLTEAERLFRGLRIRIRDDLPKHASMEMIDTFLDPKEDKDE